MATTVAGSSPPWRGSGLHVLVLASAIGLATACTATHAPVRLAPARTPPRVVTTTVMLHGSPLELHLATPAAPASATLVLYASGDGGWFGAAVDMFRDIAEGGYRTVGFSARAFLRIERPRHGTLSPRVLAADYAAILVRACATLGLPADTPVILTGWSRGAAFAAIAASESVLSAATHGVVAIGLAADENLRVGDEEGDGGGGGARSPRPDGFAPYGRLRALSSVRCAVIQASRDDYLPAAKAQVLFGDNGPSRRLYAIQARNHRFSGGHAAFVLALTDALSWVDSAAPGDH